MSGGNDNASGMTSNRPYLLRAIYDWIVDNDMTPYVLVDAGVEGVRVPPHTVKDGRVVLNLATQAVADLDLGNEYVSCKARFSGASHLLRLPVAAVLAIYAQENGLGMMFAEDGSNRPPNPPDGAPPAPDGGGADGHVDAGSRRSAPHLKVVK